MVIEGNVRPQAVKLPICSDCNNTFLNQRFEQPLAGDVVSLARGQRVLLEPKDCSAIGRYLFKTHLLMELAKRPSTVDPADVAHFWRTAEPPTGWSVWAFRAQRSPLREHGVDPGSICLPAGTSVLGLGSGSVTAQNVVGALGWVVTDPKAGLLDAVLHEFEGRNHVAQIWPHRASDLDWPTTVLRPTGYRRLIQPLDAIDPC